MLKRTFLILTLTVILLTSVIAAPTKVDIIALTYSIISSTRTVGATATAIPATPLKGRRTITIRLNDTTDTVYIGHSGVTTANGFALDSSCPAISLDLDDGVIVYGIVSAGTADVRCIEVK